MKRVVTKYSKKEPYEQIEEFPIFAEARDFIHLFDAGDDEEMICVYKLKTQEQIDFFKNLGVPIDTEQGYWYVECYSD